MPGDLQDGSFHLSPLALHVAEAVPGLSGRTGALLRIEITHPSPVPMDPQQQVSVFAIEVEDGHKARPVEVELWGVPFQIHPAVVPAAKLLL